MNNVHGDSVFVGGGLVESQLVWLLPVIGGFCQERGVQRLIFERPLPPRVRKLASTKKILEHIDVRVVNNRGLFQRFKNSGSPLKVSHLLVRALYVAVRANRTNLLGNQNWTNQQVLHAVWDTAFQEISDGRLNPGLLRLVRASLKVHLTYAETKILAARENVVGAFLGHSVYRWRGAMLGFHEAGTQVFIQAAGAVYRAPVDQDESWSDLQGEDWVRISALVTAEEIALFWEKRVLGDTANFDSKLAMQKSKDIPADAPKNLVMLHVFRDSPFGTIDPSRLFADYVEWVSETLRIIAESSEQWIIKLHPSATKWGENQRIWLDSIAERNFVAGLPKNVTIVEREFSNFDLFQHVERLVTYNGTAHLEAACWGIRPVTVSKVSLGLLDADAVFTPSSRASYRSLLLAPSGSSEFRLGDKQVSLARQVLFCREQVLRLGLSLGEKEVFRGDGNSVHDSNFKFLVERVPPLEPDLSALGRAFARGIPRAVSLPYLRGWVSKYLD